MSLIQVPTSSKRWVSLTPLIDVVFILIMFFMLTTQFERTKVLELSVLNEQRQSSNAISTNDIARVLVMKGGIWLFNGKQYSLSDSVGLQKLTEFESVLLTTNDDVVLQSVVKLMDEFAAAGVTQVSWIPAAPTVGQ